MERKIIHSNLVFNNYVINKSLFEVNQEFNPTEEVSLDFKLSTDFKTNKNNDEALVVLICEVFKGYKEKNYPFYIYVEIIGNFYLQGEAELEFIELCKVNGTAILFPYLRAYISYITSISGVPNLILPTVNVLKMLEDK
jgi:preprotein translocase subunit SecB